MRELLTSYLAERAAELDYASLAGMARTLCGLFWRDLERYHPGISSHRVSLITAIVTEAAERQRAISLWAATTGLGAAIGPVVGGLLLARFWWGSVFLINVPVAVLGFAFAIPLIPESKNPEAKSPDLAGAVLSIAGLGLLVWSLIEAPARGRARAPGQAGVRQRHGPGPGRRCSRRARRRPRRAIRAARSQAAARLSQGLPVS